MPRRNALKDTKIVKYAYRLGVDLKGKEIFGDIKSAYAYFSNRSGTASDSRMGTEENYSLQLLFDYDENTRFIDQYSKIWVDIEPLSSSDKSDYLIVDNPQVMDGQILISCKSSATNGTELYYEYEGSLVRFMAIWDEENFKFIVPSNMYLPIDFDTKMWYIEPEDIDDENYSMSLLKKTDDGKYITYEVEIGS